MHALRPATLHGSRNSSGSGGRSCNSSSIIARHQRLAALAERLRHADAATAWHCAVVPRMHSSSDAGGSFTAGGRKPMSNRMTSSSAVVPPPATSAAADPISNGTSASTTTLMNANSSSAQSSGRQDGPSASSGASSRSGSPKPSVGDVLTLRCARLGSNAMGICLTDGGFVLMVPRALPGELLQLKVTAVKGSYGEAAKLCTLEPHAWAVAPPCPHSAACGGCPLQALDYEAQLREKRNTVVQLMARVGGLRGGDGGQEAGPDAASEAASSEAAAAAGRAAAAAGRAAAAAVAGGAGEAHVGGGSSHAAGAAAAATAETADGGRGQQQALAESLVRPTVGAPEGQRFAYRNKVQFAFGSKVWSVSASGNSSRPESSSGRSSGGGSDGGKSSSSENGESGCVPQGFGLGFFMPDTNDIILPITECLLQGPEANRALEAVRRAAQRLGLEPHDAPSGRGVLRHLIIRSAAAAPAAAAGPAAATAAHAAAGADAKAAVAGMAAGAPVAAVMVAEGAAPAWAGALSGVEGFDAAGAAAQSPLPSAGATVTTHMQLQVVIVTTDCHSELLRPLADAMVCDVPGVISVVHSIEAASGAAKGAQHSRAQQQQQRGAGGSGRKQLRQQARSTAVRKARGKDVTGASSGGSESEGDGGGDSEGMGDRRRAGGARALRIARSTVLYGLPALQQQLCGLSFTVGPHSFFQTNSYMAQVLYDLVGEAVRQLPAGSSVLDLYTGTGTIALSLAKKLSLEDGSTGGVTGTTTTTSSSSGKSSSGGGKSSARDGSTVSVWGADVNAEAIEDARRNAEANGVSGAQFVCGDLDDLARSKLLPGQSNSGSGSSSSGSGGSSVIVVDPARAGLGPRVVDFLKGSGAPRIVYVSCNAATQARDVGLLAGSYRVASVTPVDMFPQTEHVETIAVLERVVG